jgi:hypothetical protein
MTKRNSPVSRRNFVKHSAMAIASTSITLPTLEDKKKDLFVHHVYFWLKNSGNADDLAALLAGLEKLRGVPTIQLSHVGTPAPTNRSVIDTTYSVSWLCFFKDDDDQAIYQTHPIHLKFVEECAHLWEKVIVYDSIGQQKK